uniref:Uncharacterized protein n=1 Tax=Coccidioides posadasii RMSCC 3488 TaxID=454284 RepID=A0A0J6FB60_COCPO|nr:hypothetical protein CPAG_02834 [Coccidioides posadasii RMSCC 3488]
MGNPDCVKGLAGSAQLYGVRSMEPREKSDLGNLETWILVPRCVSWSRKTLFLLPAVGGSKLEIIDRLTFLCMYGVLRVLRMILKKRNDHYALFRTSTIRQPL